MRYDEVHTLMNMNVDTTVEHTEETRSVEPHALLDRGPFFVLVALVFLLPFFFVPSTFVPLGAAKGLLFFVAVAVLVLLWILSVLRQGTVAVPRTWLLSTFGLLSLVYLIASVFSGQVGVSLVGEGFVTDTFAAVLAGSLLLVVLPAVVRSKRDTLLLYAAALGGFIVVALVQIARFAVDPESLTLVVLQSPVANLLGKWNDVGVFAGLVLLLSVFTLEVLPASKTFRNILYGVGLFSLFFVALVQFTMVWYAVGGFALLLLLYQLSMRTGTLGTSPQVRRGVGISVPAVVLVIVSIIFIVAGGPIDSVLTDYFNTAQVEVRPSWQATWSVASDVLRESPLVGIGPNRFSEAWFLYKPDGVNTTAFWSVPFNLGIGFIPSTLVSVGVLGFVGWVAGLVVLLLLGARFVFRNTRDVVSQYLVVSSFIASLYLWVFMFLYTPGLTLFALAFVFTGLFLATLEERELLENWKFSFSENPTHNFVGALVAVVLLTVVGVGGYSVATRFIGGVLHQRGVVQAQVGTVDAAEQSVMRALTFSEQALFHRTLAEVQTVKLTLLLQRSDLGPDTLRSQFQTILSNALTNAQRATTIESEDHQNWMTLGRIYEELIPVGIEGAYESARSAYEEARVRNPRGPDVFLVLARLEARRGDNDAAREHIAGALGVKGNYTDAIFLLSQIEIGEGNVSQAIRSVEAATVLEPNNPVVFFQLGILRYSTDDFTGAASAFETAVALNSVYANARYFLGLSYDNLGRRNDAIAQFEEVGRLNPDNREVEFILSNLRAGREPFADVQPPLDDQPELRPELPADEPVVEETGGLE